jgi:large subunit ribosomal protein L18
MDKKTSRIRRRTATRAKIKQLGALQLCVHRTPQHIYAQIIDPKGSVVVESPTNKKGSITLVSASTLDKEVKAAVGGFGGNVKAAIIVGKILAKRAKEKNIEKVAFDRSGFRYHGRIKALADAAREEGLQF